MNQERLAQMKKDAQRKLDIQAKEKRHQESMKQQAQLEQTVVRAFQALVQYLDKKVSKTEVVNQLKTINTPDVLRLIPAIQKLDRDVIASRIDLKPLETKLETLNSSIKTLPASMPKAEKQQFIDYTKELKALQKGLETLQKVVKDKDLSVEVKAPDVKVPEVVIPAPIVNVEPQDLKPIQKILDKLVDDAALPFQENGKPARANVRNGSQEVVQTNVLVDEKYDEYRIIYDDINDREPRIEAIEYLYKSKPVARVNYLYERGHFSGAKKVSVK